MELGAFSVSLAEVAEVAQRKTFRCFAVATRLGPLLDPLRWLVGPRRYSDASGFCTEVPVISFWPQPNNLAYCEDHK